MTEYNEGDLVEGVKGESVVRGRLDNIGNLIIEGLDWRVAGLIRSGFTIRVIEKAAPVAVLPRATVIFDKGFIATWWDESLSWSITGYERAWGDPDEIFRTFGNEFVRLEPVSRTATTVLNALNDFSHPVTSQTFPGRVIYNDGWDAVAAEFGVEL